MSLLDLVRRHPAIDRVAAMVDAADTAIETDPGSARVHLRDLGARPWFRAPDHDRIAYGFALRAYAAWLERDMTATLADIRGVVGMSTLTDPLLPLVPVFAGGGGTELETQAQVLADRFGGCGRLSCGHPVGLEGAIALLRQADHATPLLRWARHAADHEHEAAIRIVAFGRAWGLGDHDAAEAVLEGPGERLLTAQARVAYDTGRQVRAIELVSPDHDLAIRSTLTLLLKGEAVPEPNRRAVEARAEREATVAALLAESDGHYSVAAGLWRRAGHAGRAWEAEALADPTHPGEPPEAPKLDSATVWFAHAAGTADPPTDPPVSDVDAHNAAIGTKRARLRTVREGAPIGDPAGVDPSVVDLHRALEALRESPAQAASMLAAASPDAPAAELVATLADAPRKRGARPGTDWEAWSQAHLYVAPLPRRSHPVHWLTSRQGLAAPVHGDLDPLPPEQRLPVLAAIVGTGSAWGRAVATEVLSAEALSTALPQALPDLPALAAALAARADLDAATRRRASLVATAALANGVARGAWAAEAAEAAARRVRATVADLLPDPDDLSSDEAFQIDRDALEAFPKTVRRRAVGPVLCHLAKVPLPAGIPESVADLYTSEPVFAALLLKAGRPDGARRVFQQGDGTDTMLAAGIAAALAGRHLAAKRPIEALHELATIPDPTDLVLLDDDLLDRVAAAVVRARGDANRDMALRDAEVILEQVPYQSSVATMVVELLLARTNSRPGSAALDVADLERAYEIDPEHPLVARSLSFALVVRGMETVETRPTQAVADVDRATDLYMADAKLVEMAANVALNAGAILWGKQRNRAAASRAIDVALSIEPNNPDAVMARRVVRGY